MAIFLLNFYYLCDKKGICLLEKSEMLTKLKIQRIT